MKKKLILGILVLISIISHRVWFFDYSILAHGDWNPHFSASLREYLTWPFLWSTDSLGSVNLSMSFYPFNLLHGLLAVINVPYALIERWLFLWVIVVGDVVGSYLLVRDITKSSSGAVIATFVYTYNTYFLVGSTGHLTIMTAFALAPLALLFFIKTVEEKKMTLAVSTGLLLFVISYYEMRAFYILALVCFLYFLWNTFFIEHVSTRSTLRSAVFAFMPMLLVILLNIYWIIGLMKLGVISNNEVFNRGLFGDSFMNVKESFVLFHPFWTGTAFTSFKVQPIPLHFFLIPIAAFFGLWLNRGNKKVVFFGVVALLGILLSKQVSSPFEDLYLWLYEHFPGFNAFRESSKFYFLIALGYSVLIGSFVAWLWANLREEGWKIYSKYILSVTVALLFLWNTKPLITGEIGTLFVPRNVPQDYILFKDYILHQSDGARSLWVPISSRWSLSLDTKPNASLVNLIQSDWQSLAKTDTTSLPTEDHITTLLTMPFADALLDISSIKYVIVPLRDTMNDDDFFKDYGDRSFFINELDKLPYLHRVDIGTKDLVVYENANYRPRIYTTRDQETIYEDVPFEHVDFRFVNPTEYKVRLENISKPLWVNFSEAYHSDWKLRAGDFRWFDVLTSNSYFLPDVFHSKNDANLNSFLIDPSFIKENLSRNQYRVNPDGSIDLDLALYFKPQSYCYIGLIVSSATLAGCLGYLGYAGVRSYRRGRKGE